MIELRHAYSNNMPGCNIVQVTPFFRNPSKLMRGPNIFFTINKTLIPLDTNPLNHI